MKQVNITEYVIHNMLLLDDNIHCVNCKLIAEKIIESKDNLFPVCIEHKPVEGMENSVINSTGFYTEIFYLN